MEMEICINGSIMNPLTEMETATEKSSKTNTKLKWNNSKWKRNENGKIQNGMESFHKRFAYWPLAWS